MNILFAKWDKIFIQIFYPVKLYFDNFAWKTTILIPILQQQEQKCYRQTTDYQQRS